MRIVRHERSLLLCRLVLQTHRRRPLRRRRLLTSSCKLSVFSFRTKRHSRNHVLVLTHLCCCSSTGWRITTRRSSSDARRSVAATALMMMTMTRPMTSNGAQLQSSRDKRWIPYIEWGHWGEKKSHSTEKLSKVSWIILNIFQPRFQVCDTRCSHFCHL